MAGLPWVRLDTTLPDNPKILELLERRGGVASAFVYVSSLAYAGGHGTDGFIRSVVLGRIHGKKVDAANLVAVGLWDETDGGWFIHGWDEYQPSTEVSEKIRAQKKTASRKGNCVRHHGPDCGCWQRVESLRAVR